jgi:enamine deaminase RidA (YjgF/YER057c/UK114 family)
MPVRGRETRAQHDPRALFIIRDVRYGDGIRAIEIEHRYIETRPMSPEDKLAELKFELPAVPKPQGVYKPIVFVGNLIYVSGHGPLQADKTLIQGRVGADLDLDGGRRAARQVGLAMLATLREYLGSLNRVRRLVKTFGLVNCTAEFHQQPAVINGFSELMAEVFGPENGIGARSAVGAPALPGNMAVEVEAIFEIE